MERIDIFEENKRLRQELEQERRQRKEWHEKYSELEKKFKELEKKFNQLLNSNMPTSKIPLYLKQYSITRHERGSNKRGKPKGGNGGSRKPPKHHDEKVEAIAESCPQCKSHRIKKKDKYKFTVYDFPVLELIRRLATVFVYCCKDCGCKFEGTHPLVPLKGQIGPRLQAFFTVIKHHFGGAYGKISDFTNDLLGESFSPNAINDTVSNVASTLKPSYDKIRDKVKEAKVKQSDETGWPVNGNSWWLWAVITASYVYVWIDEFRSSKVLEKIFGVAEDFVGVLVSDCFSAYHAFKVVCQKCWLHLLRKAKFEAKKAPKKDISKLYESLHEMYSSMVDFLKRKPDKSQRIWQAIIYRQKLERICNAKWKSEQAISLVKRIKKYSHQWLVGIIIPEVPLHNNDNEGHIKSLILPRKVCGGHRTEQGAKNFAIIASHLQTWRKRGHSQFKQLCEHMSKAYAGLTPSI